MPEVVEQEKQAELPLKPPSPTVAKRFVIPDEPEVIAPATSPAKETQKAEPVPAESGAKPAQDTEEQAPSTKPEGDKPEEELTPEQAAKREGRRFERRLDKAYRKAAEAQARAELLEKQIEELKQPPAPEGRPTLEKFDYDPEKYATALADYEKKQAFKQFEEKQRTEAGKQAQQKLVSVWEEKVGRGEDKYDDFLNVVGDLQPTNPFITAIMEADNGEEIAYHLGKNPKEAKRIAELPPISQVREIGKLEIKLAAKPAEPKTPSKAPAPITPLTGTAPVVSDSPSDNDDTATWIKKRQKQIAARRG